MNDPGHRYKFGGPAKTGWPSFDAAGKIVREVEDLGGHFEVCRSPLSVNRECVKHCGSRCLWAETP